MVDDMSAIFEGTDESETLTGWIDKDTLIGFGQADRLEAGAGDDTYIWSAGDSNDVIYDFSGSNVLRVTGVDPELVTVVRSGMNLLIQMNNELNEVVTVSTWFAGEARQLASVEFGDGTVWTRDDVNAMAADEMAPFSARSSANSAPTSAPTASPAAASSEASREQGGGCNTGAAGLMALFVLGLAVRARGKR
jgi:Ca2+-binding RTX toxin-like protein